MMCSSASTSESPPEEPPNLIPSLPNDVASNCLARVPRSHHPILRLVSKPIGSHISSTLLYTMRALINSIQHFLYLCVRFRFPRGGSSLHFFTLNQNPNTQKYVFTPIPSFPSPPTIGSGFAVLGHEIYVLGGSIDGVPSPFVWVLDCRLHAWEKAPSMLVGRECACVGVIDTKIYVFGGCAKTERNWAEVFDTKTKSWSRVCSEMEIREKWMHACEFIIYTKICGVIGDKIYGIGDRGGVKYDPKTLSWESVECGLDIDWRGGGGCVVNGLLYWYGSLGKIRGFDVNTGVWRELRGVDMMDLPLCLYGVKMVNWGGNLVVLWEGKGRNGNVRIRCMVIQVDENGGDLWGNICWSGSVLSVPGFSAIVECVGVTL